MASPRERLAALARALLDAGAGRAAAREAAHALHALCCEQGGLDAAHDEAPEAATRLAQGIALAPRTAAGCILDPLRTTRFLRGLAHAIDAAHERFGEPVEVLYAGCGPFAPLFFPLAAGPATRRARFTLLDVHAASIACVRRLAAAFGVQDRLHAAEVADACAWRAPSAPHVIVAEVMQAGLACEPQVAVMRALAPQLAPGGFMLPEEITLTACLADVARSAEYGAASTRVVLGDVLRLRADELRRGLPQDEELPARWRPCARSETAPARALAATRIVVPAEAPAHLRALLLTRVRIFRGLELAEDDSGLTVPQVLHALGQVVAGSTLEFRYLLGAHPQLDARAVA